MKHDDFHILYLCTAIFACIKWFYENALAICLFVNHKIELLQCMYKLFCHVFFLIYCLAFLNFLLSRFLSLVLSCFHEFSKLQGMLT